MLPRLLLSALAALFLLMLQGPARAQDRVWVQIEAQPTLADAEERAEAYAGAFGDVQGFRLASGWYAIVLGPYVPETALTRLQDLRDERLIPGDSFVADGGNFREQYWPVAGAIPPLAAAEPLPLPLPAAPDPDVPAVLVEVPDETAAEARRSEADLPLADRQALQSALQWFGFYAAAIDGAFGPGTRNAMAAWQEAGGLEATGVLTRRQRSALVAAWQGALAALGLERVTETQAGIEIDLPLGMVAFGSYEPPFVRYGEKDGSGVQVLLISQPGDQSSLFGLYDILQTLEIVPLNGERSRDERSFEITGRNGSIESYSYAALSGGLIKGFTLVWPLDKAPEMARVLAAMKTSFRPVGDRALDPGLAPMADAARSGLLAGLEVRRPLLSRSGFYIDAGGAVLTTTDVLQSCARLTLDGTQEADVTLRDDALGIAVLTPRAPLAPQAFARLQTTPERLGTEVAVAGYPFEDVLPAPTLTFGTLAAREGLDGEPGLKRLDLTAQAGDAGGPVIDGTGAVLGMLLPRAEGAQVLPAGVAFAAAAAAIAERLGAAVTPALPGGMGALPPEDLTLLATRMTVLVSCWD